MIINRCQAANLIYALNLIDSDLGESEFRINATTAAMLLRDMLETERGSVFQAWDAFLEMSPVEFENLKRIVNAVEAERGE